MDNFTLLTHYAAMALYTAAFTFALVNLRVKVKIIDRLATGAALAGLFAQVLLLAVRWFVAGFLPVTGLFSTLHFLSIFVMGITVYFLFRYGGKPLLPASALLALIALWKGGAGQMALAPLTPALDTPLFFLHVATSFAAYGLFGVAAIVSVYRIASLSASEHGMERRMLDECLYLGYILFSWCMIAGSLWAYLAWGSYFTWRLKGLWSTILWFYYSGVLHVRNKPGWQGRPLDLLAIAGFALTLFTFLGLSLIFDEASHPLK
ncbi:hypothetical protein EPN96_11455 [bacterium]|nr:MAG: hypothetical protein EPN96_11455 [bacterium]